MNNREWLYSLDVADLADWFDSEHDGTLDGDTAALNAKIAELTAERDKLKELNEYHALQYELASEDCDRLQAQVDELTAEHDNWKANCEDWKKDCERYRSKFGKCLDYADAIHALMDDEGLA